MVDKEYTDVFIDTLLSQCDEVRMRLGLLSMTCRFRVSGPRDKRRSRRDV